MEERPVRPGDWIRLGTLEGIVKRVRIRSTEIEAFDRSEIIVPNSDLIATSETSYTVIIEQADSTELFARDFDINGRELNPFFQVNSSLNERVSNPSGSASYNQNSIIM